MLPSKGEKKNLECQVLMLMAGYSARHCAFKKDEGTSLGVEPGSNSQVLGSCQGLLLLRAGLCGSGLQFWHHSGPAPLLLSATRLSFGTRWASLPPTHPRALCAGCPSPDLTAIIFKLFWPFSFSSSDSSLVKISFSTFSLSYLSACAGGSS